MFTIGHEAIQVPKIHADPKSFKQRKLARFEKVMKNYQNFTSFACVNSLDFVEDPINVESELRPKHLKFLVEEGVIKFKENGKDLKSEDLEEVSMALVCFNYITIY